jgi:hypothetical protein
MRALTQLLAVIVTVACAIVQTSPDPGFRAIASAAAQDSMDAMLGRQDSSQLEQGACATAWSVHQRNGSYTVVVEAVRPPAEYGQRSPTHIEFACDRSAATVHTHPSGVCIPSGMDSVGYEPFGILVCRRRCVRVLPGARPDPLAGSLGRPPAPPRPERAVPRLPTSPACRKPLMAPTGSGCSGYAGACARALLPLASFHCAQYLPLNVKRGTFGNAAENRAPERNPRGGTP